MSTKERKEIMDKKKAEISNYFFNKKKLIIFINITLILKQKNLILY
jgi:hypothetical protein